MQVAVQLQGNELRTVVADGVEADISYADQAIQVQGVQFGTPLSKLGDAHVCQLGTAVEVQICERGTIRDFGKAFVRQVDTTFEIDGGEMCRHSNVVQCNVRNAAAAEIQLRELGAMFENAYETEVLESVATVQVEVHQFRAALGNVAECHIGDGGAATEINSVNSMEILGHSRYAKVRRQQFFSFPTPCLCLSRLRCDTQLATFGRPSEHPPAVCGFL